MRRSTEGIVGFWLSVILLAFSSHAVSSDTEGCLDCHKKEAAAETEVHALEGVGCVACHGGDPAATEKQRAHSPDLRERIARQNIPTLCGDCHSDVRKMNPYGIATDQFAQYLTSKHGEALKAGKTDAATCVDCHGTHAILKADDPKSPVYAANIPKTCAKCHANEQLMEKHELPATAVQLYGESVHADLLLNKGDLSAPNCATCHGNHGATPPGFSDITHVCGKCHVRQQELFAQSPHAPLVQDGIFESCVTCHTNHKVLTQHNEIGEKCLDCHSDGEEAMNRRDQIFALLDESGKDFSKTEERLASLTRTGFHTEDEQLLLEEAKTSLLQLPPIQHTLDLESFKKMATTAESGLKEINNRLDQKEKLEKVKRLALLPIWLFLGGMALVFWAKGREVRKRQKGGTPWNQH